MEIAFDKFVKKDNFGIFIGETLKARESSVNKEMMAEFYGYILEEFPMFVYLFDETVVQYRARLQSFSLKF